MATTALSVAYATAVAVSPVASVASPLVATPSSAGASVPSGRHPVHTHPSSAGASAVAEIVAGIAVAAAAGIDYATHLYHHEIRN